MLKDTSCYWFAWYGYQRLDTGTGAVENKETSDHPNDSILRSAGIPRRVLET